ncbi:MAG: Sjogren's syndrome/scleroderma autoantigen 1 family protein [Candidatus Bathyarchaeota archaeon]
MTEDKKTIKEMADLLRQGATLTEHSCPACSSPLFKLRSGDLWCASCQKRVIIVREGEKEPETNQAPVFSSLESTIIEKIQAIEKQLTEETDATKLQNLGATLSTLLESLEKIRKMNKAS